MTLSVRNNQVAGQVHWGNRIFQIRPLSGDIHVVREIISREFSVTLQRVASTSFEDQVFELVNTERLAQGLQALKRDSQLDSAADGYAEDMALNNYYGGADHLSQNGDTASDRILNAGYSYAEFRENIAGGPASPESVFSAWMNSTGHRANILWPTVCDIGVGYGYNASSQYIHYWALDFGRRADVSTCPSNKTGNGGVIVPILPLLLQD